MRGPGLFCFAGEPAPAEILGLSEKLALLPTSSREAIWVVVERFARAPDDAGAHTHFRTWLTSHGIDDAIGRAVIEPMYRLIRQACAMGLGEADFREDLERLGSSLAPLADLFLALYDVIRAQLLRLTIEDHGRVLDRAHWRIDTIRASDRALALDAPIITLALCYREEGKARRMSFVMSPEGFLALRAGLSRVELQGRRDPGARDA